MSEQVWKEQAIHLMALLDLEKRKNAALQSIFERWRYGCGFEEDSQEDSELLEAAELNSNPPNQRT